MVIGQTEHQIIMSLLEGLVTEDPVDLHPVPGVAESWDISPDAKVYTLEGSPETAAIAIEVFKTAGINDIELINGNFDNTLPEVIGNLDQLDFVFVDGNHQKEATLKYFEWCLPKVHENTLLIFDDIYWSEGMKEAWQQIKAHPSVTVTVDLFWIGLVYFRKGQVKEDFLVKI